MYTSDSEFSNDSASEEKKNSRKKSKVSQNVGKKSKPAQKSEVYSPFLFEKDVDYDTCDDILVDDGHLVSKSVSVVKSRSKVSTEFSKSKVSRDQFGQDTGNIGKKKKSTSSRINDLRNATGFNIKNTGRKVFVLGVAGVLVAVVILSMASTWVVRLWNNTPELEARPFESSVVYARDGKTELFKYFQEERREIVDLCTNEQESNLAESDNCIPESVQLAAVALEDENFYYNEDGIPWSNIAGAAIKCLQSGASECRGGSGLSQQLVKNVTKQDDVTIERKITELLTAIKLNQEITKQDILYLYLNQISFGRNAYGVQEAAQSYFDKDIKDVNIVEACYIAALTQKPTTFNSSIGNPESADWKEFEGRKIACLNKLNTLQLKGDSFEPILSDEEFETYSNYEVVFAPNQNDFPFPHFRDLVTEELKKFRLSEQALATQGYKIITTLDPEIQRKTEESVKELEQSAVLDNGANNVASVVLDGPTGEIIAMVGSRDYNDISIDGQVNVVTSPQQPGSSIKPYVYAAALNKNFNPGTILMDVPTTFEGGFRPKNYSGGFVGAVSIRDALQNSYNIPAVKAAYLAAGEGDLPNGQAGITEVFNFSEATGLEYPCIDGAFNNNPVFEGGVENCLVGGNITPEVVDDAYRSRCFVSASIGGCEVTMLSHATGMNTFAQQGNLRTATPFLSIINTQTGRDIYRENMEGANPVYPRRDGVIDPLIARQMSAIMSDYQSRYTAFGTQLARNLELDGWVGDNAVVAKTGTTDQVRDTWTVGYSPYYTVAVWVGNTDNSPMFDNASSASAPAPIWKSIMTKIHEGIPPAPLSKEGLQPVRISRSSGFPVETGGYVELLTPAQIEALGKAQALLAKREFDPSKSSIFTNRSSIVSRKVRINVMDGLIANDLTLEENIAEVICNDSVSEFPLDPAWLAGVKRTNTCPTDESEQNQVAEQNNVPTILTNLGTGDVFTDTIEVDADSTGQAGKIIRKISIFIDGEEVAGVENAKNLVYTIPDSNLGTKSVRIYVVDSWGIENEVTIPSAELEQS
jgi:membrane peptidoglycan carboxypeptidase